MLEWRQDETNPGYRTIVSVDFRLLVTSHVVPFPHAQGVEHVWSCLVMVTCVVVGVHQFCKLFDAWVHETRSVH